MGQPAPADLLPGRRQRPDEWAIACPVCLAQPGAHCTSPRGRRTPGGSHPSRLDAWLAQQYPAATPDGGNETR